MNKPTFIISFDCEGKFGMADSLTAVQRRVITNDASNRVYRELLAVLDRFGIKATFAFVGAYTMSRAEVADLRDEFKDLVMPSGRIWLHEFWRDFGEGRTDGWLNPLAMELVRAYRSHEIGTHGFTHTPLSVEHVNLESFRHEIVMALRIAKAKGVDISTIVYPRNQVGYTPLLPFVGLTGYRAALRVEYKNVKRRIWNIASEFNLKTPSQPHSMATGAALAIPSGYILNARNTLPRRCISRDITVARWRAMIDDAIARGRVAHVWSHPHNFITDAGLIDTLTKLLAYVAPFVRRGELLNLTQDEYCRSFRAVAEPIEVAQK